MLVRDFEPLPSNWDTGGILRGDIVRINKTGAIGEIYNIINLTEKCFSVNPSVWGPQELYYFVHFGGINIGGFTYDELKLEFTM